MSHLCVFFKACVGEHDPDLNLLLLTTGGKITACKEKNTEVLFLNDYSIPLTDRNPITHQYRPQITPTISLNGLLSVFHVTRRWAAFIAMDLKTQPLSLLWSRPCFR